MACKVGETIPTSPSSAIGIDELEQRNPTTPLAGDDTNDLVRFPKKTRDLPNLSDCHNCGYRINTTNGRDKLQILRSEWRIVLLCRKCAKLVNAGEFCPYCFLKASNNDDCYRCRICSRRVHRHCILKLKGFAPSGYYSSFQGSEFTVCPDCWLPQQLLKSRQRASYKGDCRSSKVTNGGPVMEKGIKIIDTLVKDANSATETKFVARRKDRKFVAAKVVKFSNPALDLVSNIGDNNENCTTVMSEDAELAFRLHRALNSSDRVSKNMCSTNSVLLALPATIINGKSSPMSGFKGSQEKLKINGGSCSFKNKRGFNWSGDDNTLETGSQCCGHVNENGHPYFIRNDGQSDHDKNRYYFTYIKRKSSSKDTPLCTKSCGNEMELNNVQSLKQSDCDSKIDPYYFKYYKKKSIKRATSLCTQSRGSEIHGCNMNTDRYFLKYSRRNSNLKEAQNEKNQAYEGSLLQNQVSSCGSPQHYIRRKKCKTSADPTPL